MAEAGVSTQGRGATTTQQLAVRCGSSHWNLLLHNPETSTPHLPGMRPVLQNVSRPTRGGRIRPTGPSFVEASIVPGIQPDHHYLQQHLASDTCTMSTCWQNCSAQVRACSWKGDSTVFLRLGSLSNTAPSLFGPV
ncbi:hypothetical protein GE21DRAFT_1729 [Neurospora crassa]|uniref:Uncharacterized protein n=2 Tax=Neurospora crassa TaxID=5141 RepID=Q7SGG1_NEUCR|nr:hypothetical protein NCU00961 [Neurospora crassa OR74A]EAA35918.1 hypothetical protein NCU00961 [Neurospora crassa OR74A]KHE81134.1 hypothetical protein GE21DRAFT_1729 [Neurospora crassa]CAE76331.1 hypothetical protein [Neurospora crassa]|eukprot:XP_965154.1 hypothetical protein NCU00961 [Neurospora crassa OR74A]